MGKSIDFKVMEFKEQLIELVNNSQLPLTCVIYSLSELMSAVSSSLSASLTEEKKMHDANKKHEDEGADDDGV